ncbi:MAG: integral rane sensor signal transduction histidine kinase [Clostridiaceae bacterium]|jgi:signal transduction histidine kinase|nr:integral rane sensor signal transduction histidine kinase [Clostridiaceae bacterium]
MTELNFTEKYSVESEDEIGELGKSINSLSQQLDMSINELKEKNQKLSEDIEKERKLDEMRKEFIANVSHELKTPISLIQGYSEGLKVNVVDSEEDKNFYCDVIISEAMKMNKLVKSLLNLSLIDSGNLKLDKTKFNISSLLESTINKFMPIFNEKQIKLYVNAKEKVFVNADILWIEQVLVNYINNALNHVDNNLEIRINIENTNDKVRVKVFNTGKQIPEELCDKIWDSFYKVDKARTRAYGGTGLGLSIVAGIQKLHSNTYGVINMKNGVEFWFDLDKV